MLLKRYGNVLAVIASNFSYNCNRFDKKLGNFIKIDCVDQIKIDVAVNPVNLIFCKF